VAYGKYLAVTCTGCHGEGLSGGAIPGTPPDWPPAANLTPDEATGLGGWTEADFFRALREGKRPDGTDLQGDFMPWKLTAKMTDDEIRALWMYLQTLPAKAEGGRCGPPHQVRGRLRAGGVRRGSEGAPTTPSGPLRLF
jgi:cytochrome c553